MAYWLSLHDVADRSAWPPLERLATLVAARPGLPPVDPDDFLYCARIPRKDLPVLHVYRHVLTHRYLNVDEAGLVWRYVGPGGKGEEPRYALIEDVAEALALTELTRAELLAGRTRRGRRAAPGMESHSAGWVHGAAEPGAGDRADGGGDAGDPGSPGDLGDPGDSPVVGDGAPDASGAGATAGSVDGTVAAGVIGDGFLAAV
jgi:hypothetical protein